MQIIHRVSISSSPEIQRELAALRIVVADNGFVSFDVDEANDAWPALQSWIARRRASDFARTRFLKKEIEAATWLNLVPDWHHGYPQPDEDEFGYRRATYDLADWCEQCGVGMKQKAPFQMSGEPKWRRNGILQLNWVFGEYFVTPEVWAGVFKARGIGFRPVISTDGIELKTVVQLMVEEVVGIVTDGIASEHCTKCERTKYLPVVRGPFPALAAEPSAAMARTKEYFGSGMQADNRVLVSQDVARALAASKVRGASVIPVKAVP